MDVVYPAMFIHGLNLSEINVMGELLTEAGLDASRYPEAITTDEVKNLLKLNTEEAGERDAFGAPTFFIGEVMNFGQDRLRWVEQDLLAQ